MVTPNAVAQDTLIANKINRLMDYSLLINRKIIDVLIGDVKFYGEFSLPYMSGPELCQVSTTFGLACTYTWGNRGVANKVGGSICKT